MNDHNLDDLIIDTIQPAHSKKKSFLTIIALLIVVLIIGIILSKSYTDTSDTLTFEDNSTVIAPELTLQESTEINKPKKTSRIENIIEEESKEPDRPEEIHNTEIHTDHTPTQQTSNVQEISPAISPKEPKKVESEKKPLKKAVSSPHTNTQKPSVKHTIQKIPKAMPKLKYYVQVGSFKQDPSPRFLSVIKSSGFHFFVSNADALGNKKLLIGPYKTRADVDKALVVVRDRINKSAFVVQK